MTDNAYHLVDVPGVGRILAPVSQSAEDIQRALEEAEATDKAVDPAQD